MVGFLKGWAKKWTFQKEAGGTTGYLHYQVRLSLIVKRRIQEIIASTKDLLPNGAHWSITSNTVGGQTTGPSTKHLTVLFYALLVGPDLGVLEGSDLTGHGRVGRWTRCSWRAGAHTVCVGYVQQGGLCGVSQRRIGAEQYEKNAT